MSREGQKRVEVRPGVFLWLNEADQKAFRALTPSEPKVTESASVAAPENAALPTPQPAPAKAGRKPKG